ncbi:glycoside hydrolase superfamily [Xylariaceae sp. FL1272]|nr:glycoside hydrolase superfamily [Xylariaceae sp. FL1272]
MYFSIFTILFLASAVRGKVQFLGVAIAGGDFGCQIDGTCPTGSTQLPLNDGPTQMNHFVQDDGMNLMRLPISWQFLVNNQLGGDLDDASFAKYDQLMRACLDTGAHCMVDIHNFARWNGEIIGQGGPTDEQFASFWSQLAGKYATEDRVVFELMNEPHDLDIEVWAQTCQKAVTAIREAGATSQMILLPGANFDSAATLVSSGSADELLAITNLDGGNENLVLDIHKYLDVDNSGTHAACTSDNIDAFGAVADYLRSRGRRGLISETGASSDSSCMAAFCSQNTFINQNSDVLIGLVAWGAGSFSTSYILSMTPSTQDGQLIDNALMEQCVLGTWTGSTSSTSGASASTSTSLSAVFSSSAPTSTLLSLASTHLPVQNTTATRSSSKSKVTNTMKVTTWDTSYYLVLTTTVPESEFSTLAVATDTPVPSGLNGLLSIASSSTSTATKATSNASPSSPSPPSATTPAAAAAGLSRNGHHMWLLGLTAMLWAGLR